MDKREFLKSAGLAGIASLLPSVNAIGSDTKSAAKAAACTLIPSETAGPFPLDITANTNFFRRDVRENKTGVQLNLKMKIVGVDNCFPMQNVRVNIWHCDKDGAYSGYSVPSNPGQAGTTYLRGYQMTDANGEVEFITIFPGWYPGRVCHIHFQVYVSTNYAAISQLTFDPNPKQALYSANSGVYTKGPDPMTIASDGVFADGYAYQVASLMPNTATGAYDSFLELAVKGSGTAGVGYIEKQNAKQFVLGQNYPNPYQDETRIPIILKSSADVNLQLWDLEGRKVAAIEKPGMEQGEHAIAVNPASLGLPAQNYLYQLEVRNDAGIFTDCKMMTVVR